MKAIVYHGPKDFRYEEVPDPEITLPTDAVAAETTPGRSATLSLMCG